MDSHHGLRASLPYSETPSRKLPRMHRLALVAFCLNLAASIGGARAASLVTNGDFDTGSLAPCMSTSSGVGIDTLFPHTGTYDASFSTVPDDPTPATVSQTIA